ncbi:opioid growth factor receptor (macronuclear) [Tetrahymena thermophila SB210]|uniref:Opioid growth factor receptor n=1 Tax=Tetrahymena thermophila (strain SB210) TaxID=312017 RepID=I7LTZ9_TETTS|nr:opioid growth factor receptor [Tetrahymena thermophila SB210]EAR87605.1 opioid growth factor receptor [Tetrahymena thermophila SB210]|eukprot:XP_001007850.1 opioid growth factor receptor [Tetrahymena thermophila SB210]
MESQKVEEQIINQVVQQTDIQQNNQDINQGDNNSKQEFPSVRNQSMDIETTKAETQKIDMSYKQKAQQQSNQEAQKYQYNNLQAESNSQKIQNGAMISSNQPQNILEEEGLDSEQEDQSRINKKILSKCKGKNDPVLVNYANVLFYAGIKKSNFGRSELIEQIHYRYQNYQILEYDHAYIQWIFPNKYKSSFNYQSKELSDEEIEIFLVEPLLAKRIVKSYEMMLDFYGMSIKNYITGELKRNKNYKERYEDAVCGHNVLRIRRILTSLSNLGFRKYAIQLCKFLQKEINEGDRPLKNRKGDYNYDWQMYQECQDKSDEKILEANCFQKIDQINRESVFFTMGFDKQKQEQLANDQGEEEIQQSKQQKKSF